MVGYFFSIYSHNTAIQQKRHNFSRETEDEECGGKKKRRLGNGSLFTCIWCGLKRNWRLRLDFSIRSVSVMHTCRVVKRSVNTYHGAIKHIAIQSEKRKQNKFPPLLSSWPTPHQAGKSFSASHSQWPHSPPRRKDIVGFIRKLTLNTVHRTGASKYCTILTIKTLSLCSSRHMDSPMQARSPSYRSPFGKNSSAETDWSGLTTS